MDNMCAHVPGRHIFLYHRDRGTYSCSTGTQLAQDPANNTALTLVKGQHLNRGGGIGVDYWEHI